MELAEKINRESTNSYRSILRSTSLIGGASIINILIGMVRVKFVAILLGPAGVGLLGMFGQITGLIGTFTGMGIGSSGVRQVAESVGTNDYERIARTVITLRRTAWLTGAIGLLAMIAFSVPISNFTFGTKEHATEIAVLGITLFAGAIAAGQSCVINGFRQIADLAKISIIGGLAGTIISIPSFYLWGEKGIVPSLILSSFASLVTSWWFSRHVKIAVIDISWRTSITEAKGLLSLGISFMGAGLVGVLSGYLIRIILLRQFGLADVGIYQAAFGLSGMLANFVLNAMGADYFPRLTAAASDNAAIHKMVNEQTEISILLALPGLAGMLIFAPLIVKSFYAASFLPAVPILYWFVLGIMGRVFSWPLALIILAKGKGKLYFIIEVFAALFHLGAVYVFTGTWGLTGAGVAFTLLYVIYTAMLLIMMYRMVGVAWTGHTQKLVLLGATILTLLMLIANFSNSLMLSWLINITVFAGVSFYSIKQVSLKTGIIKTFFA